MIVKEFEPKDIIAYITPMVGSIVKDFAMAVGTTICQGWP